MGLQLQSSSNGGDNELIFLFTRLDKKYKVYLANISKHIVVSLYGQTIILMFKTTNAIAFVKKISFLISPAVRVLQAFDYLVMTLVSLC